MEKIAGVAAVGTFAVIALFLVVTNPSGDSAAINSLSSAYNSGVTSLQGR